MVKDVLLPKVENENGPSYCVKNITANVRLHLIVKGFLLIRSPHVWLVWHSLKSRGIFDCKIILSCGGTPGPLQH